MTRSNRNNVSYSAVPDLSEQEAGHLLHNVLNAQDDSWTWTDVLGAIVFVITILLLLIRFYP